MLSQIIGFLLVGRLVIFVLQKFPFRKVIFIGRLFEEGKFLEQLFACDLCLGLWTYFLLALLMKMNIVYELTSIEVLSQFLTGAIASFLVHIFSLGWHTKFSVIIVQ